MDNRQLTIQKQLAALYEQQKAFDHPTPAEEPAEYEPEEIESWQNLKDQIEALESELAQLNGQQS